MEDIAIEKSIGNLAVSNNPKAMDSTPTTDSPITLRQLSGIVNENDSILKRIEDGEVQANIENGINAINKVLDTKQSVPAAMTRPELGDITFDYGYEGDPNRNYKKGFGISHIIARRGMVEGLKVDTFYWN